VLGLEAKYDYTPRVYRKLVHAATKGASFADGADTLAEQAEIEISVKRLWRATKRIGDERWQEEEAAAEAFEKLPLPTQQQSPVDQVPQVVSVQMDGGRLQILERCPGTEEPEESATLWREFKTGVLTTMHSEVQETDPCPDLPPTFKDPGHMREIAQAIKGVTTPEKSSDKTADEETPEENEQPDRAGERPGKPQPLVKSVVAMVGPIEQFARRLASAAYARGFHAAPRKAFLGDGSESNWGVHRRYFSHYTPIVDFVHALMYVYAAALAGRLLEEGWAVYCQWAQWLWGGEVDRVIVALTERQAELGLPVEKEKGTPRSQVAESLRYFTNQRSRMNYAEYRKQGLPITSTYVESTIKQINRRMKGTEKFWDTGVDAMLTLVGDQLSQTNITPRFWQRRTARLATPHCCHQVT
jgi:hypothetical protein